MSTALGDVGSEKATAAIANQMRKLLASDVLYASVVRPEIDAVLADNGIEGEDVPESVFVPDGTKWLDEERGQRGARLGQRRDRRRDARRARPRPDRRPASTAPNSCAESTTAVSARRNARKSKSKCRTRANRPRTAITVSVTVDGTHALQGDISSIEAGETATATIPLTPAPKGEVTLEVEAEPVPGEEVSENNEATYTVVFE